MSLNSFGRVFRFTTWGESHGPAIGAVVDGCPPGLALGEADIQLWLDKRRPGASALTRRGGEPDRVRILSGIFEGRTTGTPISLMIDNVDARPQDYPAERAYRAGHADQAYDAKYGLRDPRGGGRASARETAARVAAGAVARLVIPEVAIAARVIEIGGNRAEEDWPALIEAAREAGSSLGAIVECVATGVPAGWGAPVYAKLDAELAAAIDVDQRGQGRRDRRRLRRGAAARRGQCRSGPCRRHHRRHRDRRADRAARRVQADLVDRGARRIGPPRPLRRPARRAGGRGDGRARPRRP